jgi:hypothetical protein
LAHRVALRDDRSMFVSEAPPLSRGAIPERWLVARGDAIVGPVSTDLLLRGITHGKIPGDAMVRQPGWRQWRALDQIRETRWLRRGPEYERGRFVDRSIAALGEALHMVLREAKERTRASIGLVHRDRAPFVGLVTSVCQGLEPDRTLGAVLRWDDPALLVAVRGEVVIGTPTESMAHLAVSRRLGDGPGLGGVLMVPLLADGRIVATMELGRIDHPFRVEDVTLVRALLELTQARLRSVTERRAGGRPARARARWSPRTRSSSRPG